MATTRNRTAEIRARSSRSRPEVLSDLAWRLDTTAGLVAMFSVAFIVRILLAPHFGFWIDLHIFRTWSQELRDVGPHQFYTTDTRADYPPGYLYVFWITGWVSAVPSYLLLKLPPIICDLGLAWVAGTFAARLAPVSLRERLPVRTLVAAAVLFNPAVIALSAGWGQLDSVSVLLVLSSLLLLFTGTPSLRRELVSFLLFGIAVAIKLQSCFVFPVMAYALYRRYLYRRPRSDLVDGALSIGLAGAVTVTVWALSGLPFAKNPVELIHLYRYQATLAPFTSVNAFNFWGIIAFWRNDATGDHVLKILGLPALYLGTVAFLASIVWVLLKMHRALARGLDEARVLLTGAAVLSLLGFTLLTRMHERYLFLALICVAPLLFVRQMRLTYAALSVLFIANLWYPYAQFNTLRNVDALKFEPVFGWLYGGLATDPWQKKAWSLAVTALALFVAWRCMRWLEELQPAGPAPSRPVTAGRPAAISQPLDLPIDVAPLDDAADDVATRSVARWVPFSLVGLSSLFGLTVLYGETRYAQNLNDSSFHMQMVRWASGQFHEGRIPFDGWFPYFAIGSSFFHHYQSLPHTLTALVANVTGAGVDKTYLWFLYGLLALWPISVYFGARLLGWERWTAGAAAAISPLLVSTPSYGYEHGSYTWQGYGIYGQLWAMWMLPIAWGLTWRAVTRGKYYAAAALALALTMAFHFITGYLAVLTVGVWVLVAGAGFLHRVRRAALTTVGAMLIAAWVLVPLIGDTKFTARTEYYQGTIFNDSFGAKKILGWLFTGQIFDGKRSFPVITLLFFVGVVVCALRARVDLRARALLGAFTLSLLLFFGRRTWGGLIDLLPGFKDVQIHRFIMGVHLAGILIAAVGLSWLLRTAYAQAIRRVPARYAAVAGAGAVLLSVGVLAPAWTERAHYDRHGTALIRSQQRYDATDGRDLDRLIDIVQKRHDGRVYAGLRGNWGADYRVGSVPVHAWLADRGVDAIGFVFRTITSLSTDVEVAFDENNPAQYQMLNIRYLILPSERKPTVPAKLIASSGRHRLYEVKTSGYFQVVDRAPSIFSDRTTVEQRSLSFRSSDQASRGIYPGVAFAGASALPATFSGTEPPPGPAGSVLSQSNKLQDGAFDATVNARRISVVLLKASYDPRWSVTVDGVRAKATMMAPSLVGVQVTAGKHVVEFRYKPYARYPLLLTIGALTLLALLLVPHGAAIRARRPGVGAGPRRSRGEGAAARRGSSRARR